MVEQIDPGFGVFLRFAFARPTLRLKKVERALLRAQAVLDLVHQRLGLVRLGDIDVGELADRLHGEPRGLDPPQVVLLQQAARELAQFIFHLMHAPAEEGVATAQVVVEKGKRRAHGEGMQPQSDLGELDRHRILVHAVNHALQDHTTHHMAVVELGWTDCPTLRLRRRKDALADIGDTLGDRRLPGRRNVIRPALRYDNLARVRHGFEHAIGQIVH